MLDGAAQKQTGINAVSHFLHRNLELLWLSMSYQKWQCVFV